MENRTTRKVEEPSLNSALILKTFATILGAILLIQALAVKWQAIATFFKLK